MAAHLSSGGTSSAGTGRAGHRRSGRNEQLRSSDPEPLHLPVTPQALRLGAALAQ